ncbi:MAG: hypothetical protein WD426_15320 [Anditalea sp.]
MSNNFYFPFSGYSLIYQWFKYHPALFAAGTPEQPVIPVCLVLIGTETAF